MGGSGPAIDAVELVEEYVFDDLSSSGFSDEERAAFLDDVDDLERQLVTWERDLTDALSILQGTGSETVYRRRQGDLRGYFIREDDTLYCIGVGKRRSTYDRDLDTIVDRAADHREG